MQSEVLEHKGVHDRSSFEMDFGGPLDHDADMEGDPDMIGHYKERNPTFIARRLTGISLEIKTCRGCNRSKSGYGSFTVLSLAMARSVGEAVEDYSRASYMSGGDMVYCGPCFAKREHIASTVINFWPRILLVSFKRFRFTDTLEKLSDHVQFKQVEKFGGKNYELKAMIEHVGTPNAGHYKAYCQRIEPGKWFKMDDAAVVEMTFNQVKAQQAYVLAYERKE